MREREALKTCPRAAEHAKFERLGNRETVLGCLAATSTSGRSAFCVPMRRNEDCGQCNLHSVTGEFFGERVDGSIVALPRRLQSDNRQSFGGVYCKQSNVGTLTFTRS
jgi:hypothetical protein